MPLWGVCSGHAFFYCQHVPLLGSDHSLFISYTMCLCMFVFHVYIVHWEDRDIVWSDSDHWNWKPLRTSDSDQSADSIDWIIAATLDSETMQILGRSCLNFANPFKCSFCFYFYNWLSLHGDIGKRQLSTRFQLQCNWILHDMAFEIQLAVFFKKPSFVPNWIEIWKCIYGRMTRLRLLWK